MAGIREEANKAFDVCIDMYGAKHPKTIERLKKDRAEPLAFYDFPAEHWAHLRTTNPIESMFATVRLRHRRTKGSGSRVAYLAMVLQARRGRLEEMASTHRRGARPRRDRFGSVQRWNSG